jgi:hypothetical protein
MMKNRLQLQLFSLHELTPESAREQIQALSDFGGGVFRPEKCDTAEPVREIFNPADIAEPVRWLSQAGAWFQFKKTKPLRIEGWIRNEHFAPMWTREHKGGPLIPVTPKFPEPKFLTTWTVWFDAKVAKNPGAETLSEFFVQMSQVAKAEYGYLATESDRRKKNLLIVSTESPTTKGEFMTVENVIGDDPSKGVPGLYWLNLFGPEYSRWLGPKLKSIPGMVENLRDESTLVRFCSSPEECESEDVLVRQRESINLLGEHKFFSVDSPTREVEPLFAH